MPDNFAEQLCLKCGLCCNGVIFADVQLQPSDDAARLKTLGLLLNSKLKTKNLKFPQPCAAHDGCRCKIYSNRPTYCREFECALLKNVSAGKVEVPAALRVIRTAKERAERVRSLLSELGDTEETLALSKRFRRTAKKFHSGAPDETSADIFGQLTLAVHDLNLTLSQKFYPGSE